MPKIAEQAKSIKIKNSDYLRLKEKMANSGVQMQFLITLALDALLGTKLKEKK